ncbi:MAG: hypothetical protein COC06_06750 [Bacteroidales bacterium]|nr:MAG: hypothetical protein COC06_06750 [Bacteroidales bacterium]
MLKSKAKSMQNSFHENVLIEGLSEGNVKIYDFVFHYYYSGLVSFAIKYVYDEAIAEDIVQDFFFKLWVDKEKLEVKNALKSYFFTSVKNRCLDYIRKQDVRDRAKEIIKSEAQFENGDNTQYFIESELRDRIFEALNKLPEKCRNIFIMNRFDGLKPIEISEKEQISVRTVEGHIGKAIKILRVELQPYLPEFVIALIVSNL